MTAEHELSLERAEFLIDHGEDLSEARRILRPLADEGVPKAVRLLSSFFEPGLSDAECERIYSQGMFRAAELGDLEALYITGMFYDVGEHVPKDTKRASEIFKEAAEAGHAHCQWIYAVELLWGRGTYPISVDSGLEYLEKAIENRSAEACITKAGFYHDGEFGYTKDAQKVRYFCDLARKYDDTVYVPYT